MLIQAGSKTKICEKKGGVVHDWEIAKEAHAILISNEGETNTYGKVLTIDGNALNLTFTEPNVYVTKFNDAAISGNDGIILSGGVRCNMFVSSAREFVELGKNLQMLQKWVTTKATPPWHDYFKGKYPNHGMVCISLSLSLSTA